MAHNGWRGVDLDGTLAHYDGYKGLVHIGDPIPMMQERVLRWLEKGWDIRIMTARVRGPEPATSDPHDLETRRSIEAWCFMHLGKILPITNQKDPDMIELWDDRVVQVEKNTGKVVGKTSDEKSIAVEIEEYARGLNERILFGWEHGVCFDMGYQFESTEKSRGSFPQVTLRPPRRPWPIVWFPSGRRGKEGCT